MASNDVREMLNLPADGVGSRPARKQKGGGPRPNLKGLAREVQSLGGDNPIAIVPEISSFKKRRFGSRKPTAKWEMRSFRNTAREDGSLVLKHWRRKTDGPPPNSATQPHHQDGQPGGGKGMGMGEGAANPQELEDSSFAKFNVKVDVPQYSDDQYNSTLANNDWTKDETDYLVQTVREYDLRWPLIWDRYEYQPKLPAGQGEGATDPSTAIVPAPKARSMEDLKARYYEVAAKMMAVQKPVQYMNQAEFALHETMGSFNAADETRRKKFAEALLGRSKEEAREEESLLLEVRRILARTEKFNQERRELYNRLDYPQTESTQDLSTFKTSNGLQTLLQNLMSADKSKKRKSLMASDGQNTPASAGPSAHPSSTPTTADTRRESIATSANGHRDSVASTDPRLEKPSKKGAANNQQPERRKLTEQEEIIYGVSTHDRLPSGPTFRYEKINKILTQKSNAQHARITNTLSELDVPPRLTMPTKAVVDQMERLLSNITTLLDMKKVGDKLDAEIRLEQAKKLEKDKARAASISKAQKDEEAAKGEKGKDRDQDKATAAQAEAKPGEASSSSDAPALADAAAPATATADTALAENPTNGTQGHPEQSSTDAEGEKPGKPGASVEAGVPPETKDAAVKEEGAEEDKGRQKRSASVLSSASDKNPKRQKN